ncbi:MAG: hypothetical protein U1E13_14540 [Methylophilaceae bacterium]|nr:hypothetical protein [Methylophilaceae bacterium]
MSQLKASNAVYNKILLHLQNGEFSMAEQLCLFELGRLAKEDDKLYFYLGTAARFMNKSKGAIIAFEAAIRLAPENIDYLQACASACEAEKEFQKALELIKGALRISPNNLIVKANYAVALERVGDYECALGQYENVLVQDPQNLTANLNYGSLLCKFSRKREALEHNRLAHARHPEIFSTLYNLIDTLIINFCYEEALNYCDVGLAWQPRHAQIMIKKAMCLSALAEPEKALEYLSKARIINPQVLDDILPSAKSLSDKVGIYLDGYILQFEARYNEQKACFWKYRDQYISQLNAFIGQKLVHNYALSTRDMGFKVMSLAVDALTRKKLMGLIATQLKDFVWLISLTPFQYSHKSNEKIRVGYLSPDFRRHATSVLSRRIYGLHDRSKLEVYCYSLRDTDHDDYYLQEIRTTSDKFHDVSGMTSVDIAKLINAEGIDILVDLAGYTAFSRPEVMVLRPAPIQFSYLGFVQTMGQGVVDYVLVDKSICPNGRFVEWHEEVIRLPNSLWPYDNQLSNSHILDGKTNLVSSTDKFVFCCFNNSYKIEPEIFRRWMNILKKVPNSVLWLFDKESDAEGHLRQESQDHGIDPSRLMFMRRIPMEQHLLRYQSAHLFLDTYWVNAHTTAAEALWQGLPLITIMGEVPSARGAASILTALEMPGLIVQNHDEYEQLAIYYATHPQEYAAMREKLKAKRYTAPMYNTKLTVKHIEKAYQMAWERYQAGLAPAAFDVPENTDPELRKSIH